MFVRRGNCIVQVLEFCGALMCVECESGEREEAAASSSSSSSSADEGMTHMCSHVEKLFGWNLEFSQEL